MCFLLKCKNPVRFVGEWRSRQRHNVAVLKCTRDCRPETDLPRNVQLGKLMYRERSAGTTFN